MSITDVFKWKKEGKDWITREDEDGLTALHIACLYQNKSLIREIFRLSSSPSSLINSPDNYGHTPLQYMRMLHYLDIVAMLVH